MENLSSLVYFNIPGKKLNSFKWFLYLYANTRMFFKSLIFKGLGYRIYKNSGFFIVKTSYTRLLLYALPLGTECSVKKKRWVLRFSNINKENLYQLIFFVKLLYSVNPYKFFGFKFRTKKKFKIGKKARY